MAGGTRATPSWWWTQEKQLSFVNLKKTKNNLAGDWRKVAVQSKAESRYKAHVCVLSVLVLLLTFTHCGRSWRRVPPRAVISFQTRAGGSCGVFGGAVVASIALPALGDRGQARVRAIGALWTASQVQAASFRAVKTCRSQPVVGELVS